MTTARIPEWVRRALGLSALAVATSVLVVVGCGPRREGLDPSSLPEEVRADYEVFARKCSKCHGLSRPLQSGITDDEQWVMYVRRMRRQQGSGISPEDEVVILRFLRYYAADQRRIQAEKKGGGAPSAPQTAPPPPPATSVHETPELGADGGAR